MRKKDVLRYYQAKSGEPAGSRKIILAVANDLGCWPQTVEQWEEVIPKGRAYELYVKTNGEIDLNANDYNQP